jgi:hypothetical protein
VDAVITRERCDGCGRLISLEEEKNGVYLQEVALSNNIYRPNERNRRTSIGLCPECFAKVRVPVWPCNRCGHPRHMHNAACTVLLGPMRNGSYPCCDCSEFVPPPTESAP